MGNTTYFPSGSNHPGEILGFVDAGLNAGATITELRLDAEDVLAGLAGSGARVFMDSGAFSEVDFPDGVPTIVAPISDADWNVRLDGFARLARSLGAQLYVVAPDCVAHQDETLARLARFADRVRELRALGANVLVAHQKGSRSLPEFNAAAAAILGFDDFVAAIPMAKDATSVEELAAFAAAVRPARLHLLGLGPTAAAFDSVVAAVAAASPETELFCDAVAITRLVGRTNGKGGGPRALTAASDDAARAVAESQFDVAVDGVDYTDAVFENLNDWLTVPARRRLAAELAAVVPDFSDADRRAVLADPEGWFAADSDRLNDWTSAIVDGFWAAATTKRTVTWRKRTAVRTVFAPAAPAPAASELSDDARAVLAAIVRAPAHLSTPRRWAAALELRAAGLATVAAGVVSRAA